MIEHLLHHLGHLTPIRNLGLVARRGTSRLRVLPDFVVIGAQRCGTTSMYRQLTATPHVRGARRKELHYFDGPERAVSQYRANFPILMPWQTRRWITGEATPYLLFDRDAPARVAAVLPDARFIALLRDPVDRAYSQWQHTKRNFEDPLSFEDAIAAEPERLAKSGDDPTDSESYRWYSYTARGDYISQLERWTAHISRDRILVLQSEPFFRDPGATVARVLRWLGVEAEANGGYERSTRPHKGHDRLDAPIRRQLAEHFAPMNERLYAFLGTRFDWTEP